MWLCANRPVLQCCERRVKAGQRRDLAEEFSDASEDAEEAVRLMTPEDCLEGLDSQLTTQGRLRFGASGAHWGDDGTVDVGSLLNDICSSSPLSLPNILESHTSLGQESGACSMPPSRVERATGHFLA